MVACDLAFETAEFKARLKQTREKMRELDLPLLIVDEIEAMSWISGYSISETLWRVCAIPLNAEPFMLLRSLDVAPARERSWFDDIIGFRDWDDPIEMFTGELARRGLATGRIGVDFESHSTSLRRFEQLRAQLSDATLVDSGQLMWALRWRKSAAEANYIRQAAAVADAAMISAVGAVRCGGTLRDVVKAASATYLELGADTGPIGPITSGSDWDSLHAHEHTTALQSGTVVHIELVPRVRDYSARIMRSAVIGEPTCEQRDVLSKMIELQDRQIAALRPGALARNVDAIVRGPLVELGLRPTYENVTGYTLGAYPLSTQRISDFSHCFTPAAQWLIEPGMTFHMYTSARGLAISETVLVGEDGAERLTQTPRQLFVVN